MKQRIIGFDLARAYAIFGMFIVNFNFCFGSFGNSSPLGKFLNLFVGNSTAIFIVLAGLGVSLMTNRNGYSKEEKVKLRSVVLKRSWFLLAAGLLLYNWWPGDILHFYGAYMHIASFLLFIPKRYYLSAAAIAILGFHIILFIIPIDTAWNFDTFRYADFWTPTGFLRNTLYNGWNSVFPWLSYFMVGMWLGRLNWNKVATRKNVFLTGFILFMIFQGLRLLAKQNLFNDHWTGYIMSEYFPAYFPFVMITMGFAFMVISVCMFISSKFPTGTLIQALAKTGRMTLSLYVLHITVGMLIFSKLSGKKYTGFLTQETPVRPFYILAFAVSFYVICVLFCLAWSQRFKHGPLETIMRRISG